MTHLFGEMDLDLTKSPDQLYQDAFKIAEACGYIVDIRKNDTQHTIIIHGADLEEVTLIFKDNKFASGKKDQYTDRTGALELVSSEGINP